MKRECIYTIFTQLIKLENTLYTPDETKEYFSTQSRTEGPGERSHKLKFNLDTSTVGALKGPDHPELNYLEQKSIYCTKKTKPTKAHPEGRLVESLSTFRAGAVASKCLSNALVDAAYVIGRNNIPLCQLEILKTSLSKKQRDKLLPDIQKIIYDNLTPSKVFNDVFGIICSVPTGFLLVNSCDFDVAFEIACVSKGQVSYRLKYDYLLQRLNRQLVQEQ